MGGGRAPRGGWGRGAPVMGGGGGWREDREVGAGGGGELGSRTGRGRGTQALALPPPTPLWPVLLHRLGPFCPVITRQFLKTRGLLLFASSPAAITLPAASGTSAEGGLAPWTLTGHHVLRANVPGSTGRCAFLPPHWSPGAATA